MSLIKLFRYTLLSAFLLASAGVHAQETSYPVFNSDDPPPFGIYRTAEDYLALRPSDTDVLFKYIPRMEAKAFMSFTKRGPMVRRVHR